MKRLLIVGLIVAVVFILIGGAGMVYAKVRGLDRNEVVINEAIRPGAPQVREFSYGPGGMMGGYSYGPGGMMSGNGYGPGRMMGEFGFEYQNGPGMMGERGFGYRNGPGMMGGRGFRTFDNRGEGLMHDYMISSFAEAVGLTVEEVNSRLAKGETLPEIAIAQGTAGADLPGLLTQVQQAALDKAVADGVITQAQADFMLEHMNQRLGSGVGPSDCPMWDNDEQLP
jgi:hypothetical protein